MNINSYLLNSKCDDNFDRLYTKPAHTLACFIFTETIITCAFVFILALSRHEVNKDGKNRWHKDGLNSLNYKLVKTVKEKLYTKFVVELLDKDPYENYKKDK